MTYNVELTSKPDAHGLHHVMIRLHAKGHKPARIQTDIELEGRHWNKRKVWNKWVRSSHAKAGVANQKIAQAYEAVKAAVAGFLSSDPHLTPAQCKARYEAGNMTLIKDYLSQLRQNAELSQFTTDSRGYTWRAFLRWAGENLAIEQITTKLLHDYKNKLLSDGKKPSTINTYMAELRVVYEAIQRKRGVSKRDILTNSPFLEWENLSVTKKVKGRLSRFEIARLADGEYNLQRRLGMSRTYSNFVDWGRWCWLACHYQAGMRIGDLIRSRYEWYEVDEEGYPVRLRYQMQKNGRWINIPVSQQLRTHLMLVWQPGQPGPTYLLPFLNSQAPYARFRTHEQIRSMPAADFELLKSRVASVTCQLNRGLKKAVVERDIQVVGNLALTNHTARHSFADKVRQAIKDGATDAKGRKVTAFDGKDLMGHAKLYTTELYFGDMDQEWLDSAMDALSDD